MAVLAVTDSAAACCTTPLSSAAELSSSSSYSPSNPSSGLLSSTRAGAPTPSVEVGASAAAVGSAATASTSLRSRTRRRPPPDHLFPMAYVARRASPRWIANGRLVKRRPHGGDAPGKHGGG
eukprot:scaffold3382_cov108-Isochrysis_galbana.AAC.9